MVATIPIFTKQFVCQVEQAT